MTYRDKISAAILLALVTSVSFGGYAASAQSRCPSEAGLRSKQGNEDEKTQIIFRNERAEAIRVYWINYSGHRELYGSIDPGETHTQPTFATHPWVVTDDQDNCLNVYFADKGNNTVTIGP